MSYPSRAEGLVNSIIWKSNLADKIKRSFFQAAVVSIPLYGCKTRTLPKRLEKKLDGNYTRMLQAILNKFWRQHPTRHKLYGHLPPITKTIQVRRTRHAGHCWRIRDELIRDVLLWTAIYGRAKAGRPAWTYIQQLCEDTGCSLKRWSIGKSGERGSGISVLVARHDDDDDDDDIFIYIYIYGGLYLPIVMWRYRLLLSHPRQHNREMKHKFPWTNFKSGGRSHFDNYSRTSCVCLCVCVLVTLCVCVCQCQCVCICVWPYLCPWVSVSASGCASVCACVGGVCILGVSSHLWITVDSRRCFHIYILATNIFSDVK